MEFLVKIGPKETKAITVLSQTQLTRLLINLCDNVPPFARESSVGFILEISDELTRELYESLPNNLASNISDNNQAQILATFIREFFCQNRGLNQYAEVRFVSLLPPQDTEEELLDFLRSSD